MASTASLKSKEPTERSRLLPNADSSESSESQTYGDCESQNGRDNERQKKPEFDHAYIRKVVVALLIGVFASNADASLVLATHPVIASEFDDLGDSSWLFISFMLAGAATQALYGKLSDIYGRKSILIICYALFAIGCTLVGIGQTMWQVMLGRVISGSGGAGMQVLASVIITDLAPLREVASWQSYMNVIATVGRSIGGPLGGWLADTIGWRWSFLGQGPIFLVAIGLSYWLLPVVTVPASRFDEEGTQSRLGRIDSLGALLLGSGILSLMLPLEVGGQKISWSHPLIFILLGLGVALLVVFALVEAYQAKEPILPLRLLRQRNVALSFAIMASQAAAQLAMMFTVPIYFQVTERASSTVAGAHLFPAVIGNTIGGIASGIIIKRTGRYKGLILLAALSSMLSYTLMLLRWHGHTGWGESLYVFPGGLGNGMAQSAVFINVQVSIDPTDKAAGAAGLFLAVPVGAIIGTASSSAIMLGILRKFAQQKLAELGLPRENIEDVLRKATENVAYIHQAPASISEVLVRGYVKGIEYSHGISIILSSIAFITGLWVIEKRL